MSTLTKASWLYGSKYNFESFEIGESRLINEMTSRVGPAAGMFSKRKGVKFRIGKVGMQSKVTRIE